MLLRNFPCTDAVSLGLVMLYIAGLTSLVLGEVILIFMILAAVPIVARVRLVLPKLPQDLLAPCDYPPYCCLLLLHPRQAPRGWDLARADKSAA